MTDIESASPEGNATLRQSAEDHYYHAVDCIAEGDLAAAISAFRASLACDAEFEDAWHGLIRVLQDAGHLDEAVMEANRLAEKTPEDVLVHTRLSILYQMQGRVPEAEAEAAKARVLGWKHELKNKAPEAGTPQP
jgi:tetratricopeptide (TPR) repeat protein